MSPAGGGSVEHLRVARGGFSWDFADGFLDEVKHCERRDLGVLFDARRLMRETSRGTLRTLEVIEHPMATAPEIGELRIKRARRNYRLYFAEPSLPDHVVVALSFCLKLSHENPAWKDAQNVDIALAAQRFHDWLNRERWRRV